MNLTFKKQWFNNVRLVIKMIPIYLKDTENYIGEGTQSITETQINTHSTTSGGIYQSDSTTTSTTREYKIKVYRGKFCYKVILGLANQGQKIAPVYTFSKPCGELSHNIK